MSDAAASSVQDGYTQELFAALYAPAALDGPPPPALCGEIRSQCEEARKTPRTEPILDLFSRLLQLRKDRGWTPKDLGVDRRDLTELALRHAAIDEHAVTVGGRLVRALPMVKDADERIRFYLERKDVEAPSGIDLRDEIQENRRRISRILAMTDDDWNSYPQQLRRAIDSVELLGRIVRLPAPAIRDVLRVTKSYRMRMTPYYASLIRQGVVNDPVLLQCVPTGEMVDNVGEEIPPVAADHSPARLVDQFYPQVVTIKSTNMCAMYCTHCLRIAHIGRQDRIYARDAYEEALGYIRRNRFIRDVLITGGDAFALPNEMIRWLLEELDRIDHVRVKRLGTRIPVTAPMRIDRELLDILADSDGRKPLRVVTQINTAQEVTPASRDGFRALSRCVSAVLNQAVLLKGVNDTRVKMWKLCETIHESHVRPYYVFNCSYRNPPFAHLRVPVEVGRDIVEGMYGNVSGDAIPRYICTTGGKVPLHRDNVLGREGTTIRLRKPWSGEEAAYPDADPATYARPDFAFARYGDDER